MSDVVTPAATVVILREAPSGPPELLMIHRAQTMGFAGGAYAFPGGKVDAGDAARGPAFAGFDALPPDDARARAAAAREAFEETGVLLSRGPAVAPDVRLAWRERLARHEATLADALAAFGHVLDAAALKPFAHWVPPAGLHRRFDTLFYLARLPDDTAEEALHDGGETQNARWLTAAAALAERDAGAVELLFPTRCNLERLAAFATLAGLWADATPVARVQPEVRDRDGVPTLTIPAGLGYPVTERPLHGERRA